MVQRIPHGGDINSAICVDIEISGVLDDAPWNRGVLLLDILGELGNQFSDLDNTHTTGILKEIIIFKCRKIVVIALQIVRDPLAVFYDFLEDERITCFDRAAPHLS